MLLTLHTDSVASMLRPARKGADPKLALADLPAYARQTLDMFGLNITTDLLAGAARTDLRPLRAAPATADGARRRIAAHAQLRPDPS